MRRHLLKGLPSGATRFQAVGFHKELGSGEPSKVRFSGAARALRAAGHTESADKLEADRAVAAVCPKHGPIADPVLGILDTAEGARAVFACPWCSGSAVLAAWEAEGRAAQS